MTVICSIFKKLCVVALLLVVTLALFSCVTEPTVYTVTFDSNGGSAVASQSVEDGKVITHPLDPTYEGYTFLGWFVGETEYDFATPVTSNITLTAKWELDNTPVYSITWIDDEGNTLGVTEVEEGTVPTYTYEKTDTAEWDYSLIGWATSSDGDTLDALPEARAEATYYAKITKTKQVYTVSFVTNGAAEVDSQSVEYGSTPTEPETPEYENHRLLGWYADESFTTPVDWTTPVTGNVTYYASWLEVIDVVKLLKTLLDNALVTPFSYIPEAMRPTYDGNVLSSEDSAIDYSSFVDVSKIPTRGHGEQWHMVIENLNQSQTFFNLLAVIENVSTTSVTIFSNYFDENPADTAQHSFETGIYSVYINFDGETISYVLDYTANVPVFGEQSIQIALAMNVESGERTVRAQIGDANSLKYTKTETSYTFAIKYFGVRTAHFSIVETTDGEYEGHIYEYLTLSDNTLSSSAADFYINDDYVTVVGNKAGALIGFEGTIAEVYNTSTGEMVGYEVKEALSSIVYNTLWFDLSDITGISSIKYVKGDYETPSKFYVNNSAEAWQYKLVGGISFKTGSRRFDIEFRTRYFYSYDETTETYSVTSVKVPMLFVQEENFDTLTADVLEKNGIAVAVTVPGTEINKIKTDYSTLIPAFDTNKTLFTSEYITTFIGEKITFN